MGRPMAERVLSAGYQLTVYNRTAERTQALKAMGAAVANSIESLVASSEVIILMLADAKAIEETIFNCLPNATNKTFIQMGTIAPSESLSFKRRLESVGGEYLEAPVLGSSPEAEAGRLIIMVGADQTQFDKYQELLRSFGPNPRKVGSVGQASAMKLAFNQLIASLTSSFCLSLAYILENGINVEDFMEILRGSAVYAATFDKKLPRYLKQDYVKPNFPVKHILKDAELILKEFNDFNIDITVFEAISQQLKKSVERGFSESDYSAIFELIRNSGKKYE
jgi:3-hydroxyisobutyrate dehydrogenase